MHSSLAKSLRGISLRQVRLACGLIMFAFLLSHFTNHALGNISYGAMQSGLEYHGWFWGLLPVRTVFYAAAGTHLALGFWALYERRHFRYTRSELAQLALGLSIPLLIAIHLVSVRIAPLLFGRESDYAGVLHAYWVTRPYMGWVQFGLLLVAWTHACIGIYFWLRLKAFFARAAPFLLVVAALLPMLAILGLYHGAQEVIRLSAQPGWLASNVTPLPAGERQVLDDIVAWFALAYVVAIVLVFIARGVRLLQERRHGLITLSYPDREIRVPKGMSVLEASLAHNVPHACVCGGRARCSTCRIRVVSGRSDLPLPSAREAFVLERVGASVDPSVRLACQLRPTSDIAVIPILPPEVGADFVAKGAKVHMGEERYIVNMFVDMRGSTMLGEARLPFDTIFLINRFLAAASKAVVDAGGQPNQFIGDGLLALFGIDTDAPTACRQAIKAAAMVADNMQRLNQEFAKDLRAPIAFGIGIHGGDVVIGDIGYRARSVFTAIGDAVNVAARLEEMTKSLKCKVVISEEVCRTAGIACETLPLSQAAVRGRDQPLAIRAVADPSVLMGMVETEPTNNAAAAVRTTPAAAEA